MARVLWRRRRRLDEDLRALPGVTTEPAPAGAGTFDGTPYRYAFSDGAAGGSAVFSLTLDGDGASVPFVARREGGGDAGPRSIGFRVESVSGDADGAPPFAVTGRRLKAVQRLFDLGVTTIRHDGTAFVAEWTGRGATRLLADRKVGYAIVLLRVLTGVVVPRRARPARIDAWGPDIALGAAVTVAAGVLCAIGWRYRPLDVWQSGLAGAAAGGAVLLVAAAALRRRGPARIVALVPLPLAGVGLIWILNAQLDGAPHLWRMLTVLGKHEGVGPTVTVASWRRAGTYEDVAVSPALWSQSQPGATLIRFTTRAGRLGYERIAVPPEPVPQ